MRILITTITAGAGHLQAAAALQEAWRLNHPSDVVETIDLLTFFSPLHRRIYRDGYVKFIAHAPEIWGMVFNKLDNPKLVRRMAKWRKAIGSASARKFERFVKKFAPDAVLCTHFLPVELLGAMRGKWKGKPPLTVSVVTDFEAHALWMEQSVDLYCVAAEETKARLVERGTLKERVAVTGIPIARKFSSRLDRKELRKRLELLDNLPVLLVLSGGFGMGPIARILSSVDKVRAEFQIVVVAGKNEKLRRQLADEKRTHSTKILGFVDNMHELMSIADLIVTKPGGLTASEAMAMGKPLFILNPIPGQESANADFLLEHGAAAKANSVDDVPYRIGQLLGSPKLREMSVKAKGLGRPDSAAQISRIVSDLLQEV